MDASRTSLADNTTAMDTSQTILTDNTTAATLSLPNAVVSTATDTFQQDNLSHTKSTFEKINPFKPGDLLQWIHQVRPGLLEDEDLEKFKSAKINMNIFLDFADDVGYFKNECQLPDGISRSLAKLAREVTGENTSTKRKREHSEDEKMTDAVDEVLIDLARTASEQRKHLQEEYSDKEELRKRLSNPALMTTLPFPFPEEGKPTERFSIIDGKSWSYMGREYFTTLLGEVTQLLGSATRELSLYGTIGYGKSHLLAALVCYLTVDGKRVLYIPDCRECCKGFREYLQAAMLFTWADNTEMQESIMKLESMDDVYRFFRRQPKLLFIYDQINALDEEDKNYDALSNSRKQDVRTWLDMIARRHKVIYSASANFRTRVHMEAKQTNDRKLYVYGGFSAREMQEWWNSNNSVVPDKYTADDLNTFKSEVEDITGRIPLLLANCIVEGKISLTTTKLFDVFTQVQQFMYEIYTEHKVVWEKHCDHVTACIINTQPPLMLKSQYIDHRYFYIDEKTRKGTYACGIAREAAARLLRQFKLTDFANQDSLDILVQYIHNPSVTGFFIEQAVLSSIVTCGLAVKGVKQHVHQEMFSGDYPTFDKSKEGWALYCPLLFNYPAIDAILVQFKNSPEDNSSGKKKCVMYPIQITVAKSHADSEEEFFNHLADWTKGLDDYDIKIEFCWITPDKELKHKPVTPQSRSLRSRDILRHAYEMTHIPLKEVNAEIWSKYRRAKESQG